MKNSASLRLDVIDRPEQLAPLRARQLADELMRISFRATYGTQRDSYDPGAEAWRRWYMSKGARPQDYDRLVLVYDGQFLAHFAALDLIQGLQEGVTILWVHVAMTDPDYQGSGALLLAAKALLNPEGLALLGDELYLVFRTANPKLYEAMRTLRSTFTPDGFYGDAWYPQIAPGGTMVPVPANITELAACLAARLSPNHEFVRDTFVIKGCFQDFDPLWQDLDEFPCRNAMTKDYFTKNLDNSNQDGLMIIVQIVRPTDCREPQKIATDAESA